MSLGYLGIALADSLLARAYERGEVARMPEELAEAAALGASLGGAL
jgi:hypothetical protein